MCFASDTNKKNKENYKGTQKRTSNCLRASKDSTGIVWELWSFIISGVALHLDQNHTLPSTSLKIHHALGHCFLQSFLTRHLCSKSTLALAVLGYFTCVWKLPPFSLLSLFQYGLFYLRVLQQQGLVTTHSSPFLLTSPANKFIPMASSVVSFWLLVFTTILYCHVFLWTFSEWFWVLPKCFILATSSPGTFPLPLVILSWAIHPLIHLWPFLLVLRHFYRPFLFYCLRTHRPISFSLALPYPVCQMFCSKRPFILRLHWPQPHFTTSSFGLPTSLSLFLIPTVLSP